MEEEKFTEMKAYLDESESFTEDFRNLVIEVENLSQHLKKEESVTGKWFCCLCERTFALTNEILLSKDFKGRIQKLTGYLEGFYEEVTEDIKTNLSKCTNIETFKKILKKCSEILSFSHNLFMMSSIPFSQHSSFDDLTKAIFKLKAAFDYIFLGAPQRHLNS